MFVGWISKSRFGLGKGLGPLLNPFNLLNYPITIRALRRGDLTNFSANGINQKSGELAQLPLSPSGFFYWVNKHNDAPLGVLGNGNYKSSSH